MQKLLSLIEKGKGSEIPLRERYEKKVTTRASYLDQGKEYAKMTLPYLLPDSTTGRGFAANDQGFNGFHAQVVNSLSNRIVHNLFPAHQPFFQLEWSQEEKDKLAEAGYDPLELQTLLNAATEKVHDYESQTNGRLVMVNIMKHLIVAGNVLMYAPPDGSSLQAIPLSHYTVSRDSSEEVTEIFTVTKKALVTFPEDLQGLIKANHKGQELKPDDEVELLTWAVRISPDEYAVVQAAENILLQDKQVVNKHELPWIPLRWNTCYGEDYGRGLVEDHYSDFKAMRFLNEAVMKGMVLMSDVKFLVRAGAVTDIDQLANAPTGEFIVGSLDDVGVLQLERHADFTPIQNVVQMYERRVGQVFLMQSAVQRDGERVTAYEIRLMAQELNESLGGIYSHLAMTLQKPYASLLLARTEFPMPEQAVQPRIMAGLEALAKSGDLEKIRLFSETMAMTQGWNPDILARTDMYMLAKTIASSLSLDLSYVRNNEEQAEIDAQQQEQMMMQQGMTEATKAAPNILEQGAAMMMGGQ